MKIGMIAAVMLLGLPAGAQTFGIRGGLNLASVLFKDDSGKYSEYSMKAGFHGGLTFQYDFSDAIALETGVMLESKGWSDKYESSMFVFKIKFNPLYIDVPITIKASYALSDNFRMFGVFGPYIGLGVGGKTIVKETPPEHVETERIDIKWGNTKFEDSFQRFDAGLTFGAGVEFGRIQVGVFYDLGLVNIATNKDDGRIIKNRALKVSMGYRFGQRVGGVRHHG